jgi:NAD(P)-dependent dehydrogenase (short-subunit alcohol dehydrogenase family)
MGRLNGRNAIVTGASRALGRAIALGIADRKRRSNI